MTTSNEPPYRHYWANRGRVMVEIDDEQREVTAALFGVGRDQERYDAAAAEATEQRAKAAKAAKTAAGMSPRLVRPAGSHSVKMENHRSELITKEELYPIVELEAPRVGTVRAEFSADRYVASDGMGEWRVVLREVRTVPVTGKGFGEVASGIGPAARQAIDAAGEPLIREWLATEAYAASRRRAVAHALRYSISEAGTRTYNHDSERARLERAKGELEPDDFIRLGNALDALAQAGALLDATPAPITAE